MDNSFAIFLWSPLFEQKVNNFLLHVCYSFHHSVSYLFHIFRLTTKKVKFCGQLIISSIEKPVVE